MHGSLPSGADRVNAFKALFRFDSDRSLRLGVERECFLTDRCGNLVPRAAEVMQHLRGKEWRRISPHSSFGVKRVSADECVSYELSAVQLETKTPVHTLAETEDYLRLIDISLRAQLNKLGLRPDFGEVAAETMPLDIYPDPTGRYQKLTRTMPQDVLLAACRIIGTHVHVGMPDHDTALRVYNSVIEHCDVLSEIGDHSEGERLRIYGIVKPDNRPRPYASWLDLCEEAHDLGFSKDPRSNWRIIRLTAHGTIEFRVFGATDRIERICMWTRLCHALCKKAMT